MELTYRFIHDGAVSDVRIELVDDATVGELARVLVDRCGIDLGTSTPTLAMASDPDVAIDPQSPAADAAPPSGSSVCAVADSTRAHRPPWWSPATITRLGEDGSVRLAYGSTALGAARLVVGHAVYVVATGSTDRLEVDGTPVRGSVRVASGAVIRVGDATVVLRVDGPLRPPPLLGPWQEHGRTPAVVDDHSPVTVELPTPPSADRLPGFPFLSAAVPLLLGGIMWAATGSLAVAGFVLFSVAFVVASGIEVRREHRKERRFREEEFRDELGRAIERARELRSAELRRRRQDLPQAAEVVAWLRGDRRRLWERWHGQPRMLRVRIGDERGPATDAVAVPPGGRQDLRALLVATADELETLEGPAAVDLGESGLAVCGPGDEPAALARAVVVQLLGTLAPDDLEIELDAAPERVPDWEWLRWLPHRVRQVPSVGATGPRSPRAVVRVVDRCGVTADGAGDRARLDATGSHSDELAGTIWIAGSVAQVPDGIGTVVEIQGGGATVRRSDGPARPIVPDAFGLDGCEPVARQLAPLRPPGADDTTPAAVPLSAVLGNPTVLDRADAVLDSWARSRGDATGLRAPIGRVGAGVLHVDLRHDGPHGLVAGTTGSGKSELLRTLVASLALHHPPDRLTFLLVDYKGGAAVHGLSALPHVVGTVTDLSPAESRRALASLRAEVRRRERLVAGAGATDMGQVPAAGSAAALVVVVDEFATLAAELPDLLDGLLDVAQRGRSLGVHLLLATQRPAGVVTDAMRANLSLRLALRVADEDDSRDVVDVTDAAHLPADRPGRAILRLGPGRCVEAQVATTTSPVERGERVRVRPLHGPLLDDEGNGPIRATDASPGRSQIEAAIESCRLAARASGVAPAERPWLEPLPSVLDVDDVEELTGTSPGGGDLVIGVADLPHEQRREPVAIDLGSRGGLLVLGAPRSGRSATLRTIARAALSDATQPTSVVALDAGRSLQHLDSIPSPGGRAVAIRVDDAERTLRVLRSLRRQCRTGPTDERTVLLVDGVGAVADHHQRVNRGEALDLLGAIVSEGPAVGIHVVLTAGRTVEVPPAMLAAMDRRLVLRCATADDALMVGVADPDGLSSSLASPSLPPGRGLLDGRLIQVFAPPPTSAHDADGVGRSVRRDAAALPTLPTELEAAALPPAQRWRVPVGIRHDDLRSAVIDLSTSGALILGPPRSGRSSALDLLAGRLSSTGDRDGAVEVVRIDGHRPDGSVDELQRALDTALADRFDSGQPDRTGRVVIAVDDLPELLDGPDGTVVDDLLGRALRLAPDVGLRVIATGEADATARCYGDSLRRLRSGRTGILLRPDPDLHPPLLHTSLPLHDELIPAPGRGWLVSPDGVVAVQLAR